MLGASYQGLPTAIYARASEDPKKTGTSVGNQIGSGRAWIDRHGAMLFDVYRDNDISASRFSVAARKEYERLTGDVTGGHLKILWFWKLARQARRLEVFAQLRDLCRDRGVLWVIDDRVYDLSNSGDRWMLGIQAIEAEEHSETISSNILQAHAANAVAGRPHGAHATGYDRIYHERTKVLLEVRINEAEAEILRTAADIIASGQKLNRYLAELERRGVVNRNGNPYTHTMIRAMLTNPIYIGKRTRFGKVVADAVWPPILTEDVFYACRRVYDARKHGRPSRVQHLLSGIALARCGESIMRVETVKGHLKYVCAGDRCSTIYEAELDEYVQEVLLSILEDPQMPALLAPPPTDGARQARAEASRLRDLLLEWQAAAEAGDVGPGEYKKVTAGLRSKLAAAERRADEGVNPALAAAARPDIRDFWWDEDVFPLTRRRDVIRAAVTVRVVTPPGRASRGGRFDPEWVRIRPVSSGDFPV